MQAKDWVGLRKSTVFYMDLPVLWRLNCGAGTGTLAAAYCSFKSSVCLERERLYLHVDIDTE